MYESIHLNGDNFPENMEHFVEVLEINTIEIGTIKVRAQVLTELNVLMFELSFYI